MEIQKWLPQTICGRPVTVHAVRDDATLSNRLRLMVTELETNPIISRGLLLDHVYVKSGAVESKDGTMV